MVEKWTKRRCLGEIVALSAVRIHWRRRNRRWTCVCEVWIHMNGISKLEIRTGRWRWRRNNCAACGNSDASLRQYARTRVHKENIKCDSACIYWLRSIRLRAIVCITSIELRQFFLFFSVQSTSAFYLLYTSRIRIRYCHIFVSPFFSSLVHSIVSFLIQFHGVVVSFFSFGFHLKFAYCTHLNRWLFLCYFGSHRCRPPLNQ